MTDAVLLASALLAGAAGLLVGLRWKHRRFIDERSKRLALEARMDAYRLADTRTDLDPVGPVADKPKPKQFDQDADTSFVDLNVPPGNVIDGGAPVRMTGVRDTDAQDRELSEVYGIEQDDRQLYAQAYDCDDSPVDPGPDDTWQGTLAHLHSGEWAPAAPAPKQVGR
jgi:hypothetical protein